MGIGVRDAVSLEIWPALTDDAPMVRALVEAAYAPYIERIGRRPAPMTADYEALISQSVVWVAHRPGRLSGVLVMMSVGDHLFLENIAVHPEDQGRGLGRQLMAFVDHRARVLDLGAVELYTNEAMTENLTFYHSLGFVEIDRRTEDGFRRVFMRKTLSEQDA